MKKVVICIPCLNLLDYEFEIHRHSHAKCSACGEKRQALLVTITKPTMKECTHPTGCDGVKIKYVCEKEYCTEIKLLSACS